MREDLIKEVTATINQYFDNLEVANKMPQAELPTQEAKPLADTHQNEEPREPAKANGPKMVGDTRVVRSKSTGDKVYLLNDKEMTKRWVLSPEVLSGMGFTFSDVTEIPDEELAKYGQATAAPVKVADAQT